MFHLEVDSFFLVCHMQHQVAQHLLPPELVHGLHGSGGVGLDRVVKVPRAVHRGNRNS